MAKDAPAPPRGGLLDSLMDVEEDKSELDKIFDKIFDPANVAHVTELSHNDILAMTKLMLLHQKYKLPILDSLVKMTLTLRISKSRKGKSELVDIIGRANTGSMGMGEMNPESRGGRFSHMFRRR